MLKKTLKVLEARQDKLGKEIEKIKKMLKIIEYDHKQVLEVFKIVNDFAKELLVQPKTIDFLSPYILLAKI